jgi:hypothetical protein
MRIGSLIRIEAGVAGRSVCMSLVKLKLETFDSAETDLDLDRSAGVQSVRCLRKQTGRLDTCAPIQRFWKLFPGLGDEISLDELLIQRHT